MTKGRLRLDRSRIARLETILFKLERLENELPRDDGVREFLNRGKNELIVALSKMERGE